MHRSIDLGAAPEAPHGRLGRLAPCLARPLSQWTYRPIDLSTSIVSICLSRCCARSSSPPSLTSRRSGATTRLAFPRPHLAFPRPHLASPHPTSSHLTPPPSSASVLLRPGGAAEGCQRTRSSGALSSRRAPVAGGKKQPQPLRLGLSGAPMGGTGVHAPLENCAPSEFGLCVS